MKNVRPQINKKGEFEALLKTNQKSEQKHLDWSKMDSSLHGQVKVKEGLQMAS